MRPPVPGGPVLPELARMLPAQPAPPAGDPDPYRPMPDPVTGELVVDPDIELKSPGFDLAVSYYYSSFHQTTTEWGYGRNCNLKGEAGLYSYSLNGGANWTGYFPYSITRGDFTQAFGSGSYANAGVSANEVKPPGNSSLLTGGGSGFAPGGFVQEQFIDGMLVGYGHHVGTEWSEGWQRIDNYGISSVTFDNGKYHNYSWGSDGITSIDVDAGTVQTSDRLVTFSYTSGYVTNIQDWSNRLWTFSYDTEGLLDSYTTPLGCLTQYSYGHAGGDGVSTLLYTIEDPRGFVSTYMYDSGLRVVSMASGPGIWTWIWGANPAMMDPAGALTTYSYETTYGNMIAQQVPAGFIISYTYDSNRKMVSQETPAGNIVSLTYHFPNGLTIQTSADPLGNVTTYSAGLVGPYTGRTDPYGNHETLTYTGYRLTNYEDKLGRVTTYAWNTSRVTFMQDPLGRVSTYQWDYTRDYLLAAYHPDGTITSYAYDAPGRPIAVTDQLGRITSYAYDSGDNLISMTTADGATTQYIYNTCLLQAVVDPLGNRTSYTYDRLMNRTSMTDPNGFTTSYSWDDQGYPTGTMSPMGELTTILYNGAHQKIADVDWLGNRTSYAYDNAGRLSYTTDPRGYITTNVYNARDRIAVIDANNGRTSFTYDNLDRLTAVQTPLGNTSSTTFDAMSQVTATTDALGFITTYQYDLAGNQTTMTDANGGNWVTAYDLMNRPISQKDPTGAITTSAYDVAGQLISVQDANGNITTNSYDLVGRLTKVPDPLLEATQFGYDLAGRQISVTDPLNRITTTTLDPGSRVTAVTTPLGLTTSYSYDPDSRLTTITTPLGTNQVTVYNQAGWVTASVDELGNRTSFTYL